MTIITNDGVLLQGTPDIIVTQLRLSQRLAVVPTNAAYMAQTAARVLLWQGQALRYTDAATFLKALHAQELIEVLEE